MRIDGGGVSKATVEGERREGFIEVGVRRRHTGDHHGATVTPQRILQGDNDGMMLRGLGIEYEVEFERGRIETLSTWRSLVSFESRYGT